MNMDNVDECGLQSHIIAQSVVKSDSSWTDSREMNNVSNQTLLYIAVEYVKEECKGLTSLDVNSPEDVSRVQQHVSMLDPNMSSAARFSPVYCTYDPDVKRDNMTYADEIITNDSHETFGSVLCDTDTNSLDNQYPNLNINRIEQFMPIQSVSTGPLDGKEQKVEILITDQATGISYTVSTHELSVEDQQLLQTLSPSPTLDSTLLELEDSTLRNDLPDEDLASHIDADTPPNISQKVVKSEVDIDLNKMKDDADNELIGSDRKLKSQCVRLKHEKAFDETENKLFSHVYNIIDKQVLSRAHATLPEDFLKITKIGESISYTVSTHELSVEDQQLLQTLSPSPTIDSSFSTLDDTTLTIDLPDEETTENVDAETTPNISVVKTELDVDFKKIKDDVNDDFIRSDQKLKNERIRPKREKTLDETEDKLFSHVYNIIDKPILSRARATLPEDYLKIMKIGEEWGVFAKKLIAKRIQFGPVHGVLKDREDFIPSNNKLELLLKDENGEISVLDISDEEHSNWMCFIRQAEKYEEQNLIASLHENQIYFTAMRNINPKQELKVGYSFTYANEFNFPVLKKGADDDHWCCYECSEEFPTSEDLQIHLETHENSSRKKNVPRKRNFRKKGKLIRSEVTEASQCRICQQIFNPPKYAVLKNHLFLKHSISEQAIDEHYLCIRNYKCEKCNVVFNSEDLLKIHNGLHTTESNDHLDDVTNPYCPSCKKIFTTENQLIIHILSHSLPEFKRIPERFNCPVCKTSYNLGERLQKHMLVHGPEESKPLQCSYCKKRFLNNSALVCHSKAHTSGVNIYECPVCKDRFDHLSKLKMHVQKHCVNNTYTCPHCNKKFKAYSNIRKHIRAFHNDPKYSCQNCSKSFPTMDKLKSHQLKHSDHREFLCSDCGKQFKRKDKLNDHCKRIHSEERENSVPKIKMKKKPEDKEKTEPTDFHRFIYKCHPCLIGFKRRGMLVNHLAKRHPDISLDSVPELNLPILRATKDYYCQYCDKVYKSSFKRKVHILKNHPGAALPTSNRKQGAFNEVAGLPNTSFSQTVGSVTTSPQNCNWCHKQYASKAKLLQHKKKEHNTLLQEFNTKLSVDNVCPTGHSDIEFIENMSAFQQNDLMMTERVLSTDVIEEFVDEPGFNDEYCMDSTVVDNNIFERSDSLTSSNSHLYRLLTTANSLVTPR